MGVLRRNEVIVVLESPCRFRTAQIPGTDTALSTSPREPSGPSSEHVSLLHGLWEKETSSGYSPAQAPYQKDSNLEKLDGKNGNKVAKLSKSECSVYIPSQCNYSSGLILNVALKMPLWCTIYDEQNLNSIAIAINSVCTISECSQEEEELSTVSFLFLPVLFPCADFGITSFCVTIGKKKTRKTKSSFELFMFYFTHWCCLTTAEVILLPQGGEKLRQHQGRSVKAWNGRASANSLWWPSWPYIGLLQNKDDEALNTYPRAVDVPSLEKFKTRLEGALSSLF